MYYAASILYMVIKTPSLYYCCPLGVQHAPTAHKCGGGVVNRLSGVQWHVD